MRTLTDISVVHSPSVLFRFWSKVEKTDGCWNWMGCRDRSRECLWHGDFSVSSSVRMRSHRVSWLIHNGDIPPKMSVLHRCDNPRCVRPDHLFLGTQRDNAIDCYTKGRYRNGKTHALVVHEVAPKGRRLPHKTHCVKGHEYTSDNIIQRNGGRMCLICSKASRERERLAKLVRKSHA